MTLTKDELAELTRLINDRRDELEHGLASLSPGDVRMAHDVIMEWLEGQAVTSPATDHQDSIDSYALTDAYSFGYERGKERMRRELGAAADSSPRLVTNSAPEPEPDEDETTPDQPDAKWRDLMRDIGPSVGYGALPTPDQARANVAAALAQANGDHAFDLTPSHRRLRAERPVGRNSHVLPSREQVVAFLREIAMGKTMPTMEQFNTARPGNWATVQAHMLRLEVSWDELRIEAGLNPNPRNRNAQTDE